MIYTVNMLLFVSPWAQVSIAKDIMETTSFKSLLNTLYSGGIKGLACAAKVTRLPASVLFPAQPPDLSLPAAAHKVPIFVIWQNP